MVRILKRFFISSLGWIIFKILRFALFKAILLISFESQDHLEKVQVKKSVKLYVFLLGEF